MTVTTYPDEHTTVVEEYTVTSITANELTANRKITFTVNGAVVDSDEETFRFTKVTADYSAAILGTWQGHCTSAGSVFDDGQEHRWQYNADGNFVYYVKDGDNWVPSANDAKALTAAQVVLDAKTSKPEGTIILYFAPSTKIGEPDAQKVILKTWNF